MPSVSNLSVMGWRVRIICAGRGAQVNHTSWSHASKFIAAIGLKAEVECIYRGQSFYQRQFNGWCEFTGSGAYIVWSWPTVIEWFLRGWPRPDRSDGPFGTWIWEKTEQEHPHFNDHDLRQFKAMKVPIDVIEGKRLLTETEAVDMAIRSLKAHRKKNMLCNR